MEYRDLDAGFLDLLGSKLRRCKEDRLTYLQAEVTGEGRGSRLRDAASRTKKETVMLLRLSGDKQTAYLKYPVWRK